jgi:hypothetical protein
MAVQQASAVGITGGTVEHLSSLTVDDAIPVFTSSGNSVTANSLVLRSTNVANPMQLIFLRTGVSSYSIQSIYSGIGVKDLVLNPSGGNVYVGDSRVVTSAGSTGASVTPSGTIMALIGGSTVYLLKSTTAD